MGNAKNEFIKCSMVCGLVMGLFWAFKYIFFILGIPYPFLSFVYWGLTLFVPVLLAVLIIHSRTLLGNTISFTRDWALGILIFFFAALFVSLEHYLFYYYFAPDNYISDSLQSAVSLLNKSGMSDELKETVGSMPTPTPIQMAIQGIVNNVIYGVIVTLPVAAVTSRIKFVVIKGGKNKDQE